MDQGEQVDMIDRAIELAVKAHEEQKRKGTETAYIIHPFSVGVTLAKAGCSEEVITAGILHDVVEDARVTLSRIVEEFGEKVASIVEQCTEPDKRLSWEKRKGHTLESLKEAGLEVKFVACADKLHNIRTIVRDYRVVGDKVWRRFRRGREDQKWYYESLAELLQIKSAPPAYQRLHKEFKSNVRELFGRIEHGKRK